jgi:hypothetical protein
VNRITLAKISIELIASYFHSFEIFIIQIGEMAFCKPDCIFIKSNYFQNAQKGECFLDDILFLFCNNNLSILDIIKKNCTKT